MRPARPAMNEPVNEPVRARRTLGLAWGRFRRDCCGRPGSWLGGGSFCFAGQPRGSSLLQPAGLADIGGRDVRDCDWRARRYRVERRASAKDPDML